MTRCPSCGSGIVAAMETCPACGFVCQLLAEKLGEEAVSLERIIDAAHCLRVKDRSRLEATVDDWERRFPQVLATVYLGVLPAGVTAGEAGSWLLENGLRQSPGGGVRDAAWAVVWVIDPAAHSLAVSVGRSLAAYVPQKQLEDWLNTHKFHFWHGEYVEGIAAMLEQLGKTLCAAASPRRRCVTTPPKANLGVQPATKLPQAKPAVQKVTQRQEELW